MKRITSYALMVTLITVSSISHAVAALKAGTPCKKKSQIIVSNSYLFTCTKSGKNLIWKRGPQVEVESSVPDNSNEAPSANSSPKQDQANSPTVSQINAARKAKSYLSFSAFSRSGLIKQLEFEGFSNSDAVYGVDSQNANWANQAVLKAKRYLDVSAFSRSGLIKQLEYEGFSTLDSSNGVDAQNANWNDQAAKKAKSYLNTAAFSRTGLIRQLEFEGFTTEQAIFGVNTTGL